MEAPGKALVGKNDLESSPFGLYAEKVQCLFSLLVFPEKVDFLDVVGAVFPKKRLRSYAAFVKTTNDRQRSTFGL